MTFSPYQHQDPRQIALQRQIEQSRQDGDTERLQRLELQWVHRFGVTSLPGADQPMVQAESPRYQSEQQESNPITGDPVEGVQTAAEVPQERLESPSGIERFTSLLRESLDEVARALDESNGDALESERAASAPVPLASPRRLRRWLTPVTNDEFPQAS